MGLMLNDWFHLANKHDTIILSSDTLLPSEQETRLENVPSINNNPNNSIFLVCFYTKFFIVSCYEDTNESYVENIEVINHMRCK